MSTTIRTNNHERYFIYRHDVPDSVLTDQFDYLDEDTLDGFFQYKRNWYHVSEFERVSQGSFMDGWHGYRPDGFSCGVVIKLSDDGETYQVGTYLS